MRETPSQTAGPYVHIGALPERAGIEGPAPALPGTAPVRHGANGDRITIAGRMTDGAGAPVTDAVIETWQADAEGRMPGTEGADPAVTGFGRVATDEDGRFTLSTVKPGAVEDMAPHVALWITARGINRGLQTRIYFHGDDHDGDAVLAAVPEHRRATLIACPYGPGAWRFDIRLQGEGETVFLDM